MNPVDIHQAKIQLSTLVDRIRRGEDREIVITRNGRSVARLVPVAEQPAGKRIGLLKGKFKAPSLKQLDATNTKVARLFADKR